MNRQCPSTLLFEVSAPVHATVDQVRSLIDGDWVLDAWLHASGLAQPAGSAADLGSRPPAHHPAIVRAPGMVGMQGGWWYRGELTVGELDGEVRVVHRVLNVADRLRWAVPLANRLFIGYRERLQRAIEEFAAAVDAHLGSGRLP